MGKERHCVAKINVPAKPRKLPALPRTLGQQSASLAWIHPTQLWAIAWGHQMENVTPTQPASYDEYRWSSACPAFSETQTDTTAGELHLLVLHPRNICLPCFAITIFPIGNKPGQDPAPESPTRDLLSRQGDGGSWCYSCELLNVLATTDPGITGSV